MPRRHRVSIAASALLLALSAGVASAKGGATKVINDSEGTFSVVCTDEKNEVAINGSRNTVTITGSCRAVAVNGSDCTVTIASVEKLAVNGSDNKIDVEEAGTIAVLGSKNEVLYKRGLGGAKAPKTTNLGSKNKLKQKP